LKFSIHPNRRPTRRRHVGCLQLTRHFDVGHCALLDRRLIRTLTRTPSDSRGTWNRPSPHPLGLWMKIARISTVGDVIFVLGHQSGGMGWISLPGGHRTTSRRSKEPRGSIKSAASLHPPKLEHPLPPLVDRPISWPMTTRLKVSTRLTVFDRICKSALFFPLKFL
jgi:hypothetical protein